MESLTEALTEAVKELVEALKELSRTNLLLAKAMKEGDDGEEDEPTTYLDGTPRADPGDNSGAHL